MAYAAGMFTMRVAEPRDVTAIGMLLRAYMREAFDRPWEGTEEALARDGFGARFEMLVAAAVDEQVLGFAAWVPSYDIHHCAAGGNVLDLYVQPAARGRGVAVAMLAAIAARVRVTGGRYICGQSVPNPRVQRLYDRVAATFPATNCYVGGRAFRVLADLDGAAPRRIARSIPDKAWNHEP